MDQQMKRPNRHTNTDYKDDISSRNVTMIYGSKVLIFKKLYDQLFNELGSNLAIKKALKTGDQMYYDLCDGKLSHSMAVRILNLHKKIIKK